MKNNYKISDHYDGNLFFNPGLNIDKPFSELIKWKSTSTPAKWPISVENEATPDLPKKIDLPEIFITYVNHSTFLIQTKEFNLLTDPIWSERTSPVRFAGPQRVRKPGLSFSQLPKIDFVLVSHNHYDHMDLPSLRDIYKHSPEVIFIVPLGNAQYFNFINEKQIIELDWWESAQFGETKVSLTQVQHWSARGLFDRRAALWGGFVIKTSSQRQIFFAGDSGYNDQLFKNIYDRFGPMDISLIPIGAYEPRWFMSKAHMNPAEALLTHKDLQSKKSIGMHFGTFQLTDESIDQPLIDLQTEIDKYKINTFDVLKVGQTKLY